MTDAPPPGWGGPPPPPQFPPAPDSAPPPFSGPPAHGQPPYGGPAGIQPSPYQPYQPYGAPQYQKTDGFAVASLVLGIIWIYWIGSVLAIIFAAVALKRIRESAGWRTGRGMAIAGLVLGLVGAATLAIVIVAAAVASVS